MPLMFLNYPAGIFTNEALAGLVEQLTHDGQELEKLKVTPFVRSTACVFCQEYAPDHVFHAGQPGGSPFISVLINVIRGGFAARTKAQLIQRVTDAVAKFGNLPEGGPRCVYVVIREVEESNFGFDGVPIDLEDLRDPPHPDAKPL